MPSSTIEVTGSGKVFDLNGELDIPQTNHGQLTAILFGPDGTPVELFSNVGGSGDDLTATVLDDQAATLIPAGSALPAPSSPRAGWPPSTTWMTSESARLENFGTRFLVPSWTCQKLVAWDGPD